MVPYARGREVYREPKDVLEEARKALGRGIKDIVLIAQNVNSYNYGENKDNILDFPDLLRSATNIKGNFWLSFATSHPKDMSDKLIRTIAENKRICRHIHLPAQSGDNDILASMNRKYTREHYLELIKKIRHYIPEASITTDIIVGFPGETEEQFQNTKRLLEEAEFDMAYIAQYSPRPGTAAAGLKDDVRPEEKKRREEKLMETLRETAYRNNKKYLNEKAQVMIEGKNTKGEWYGRTDTNKNVKITKNKDCSFYPGKIAEIMITGVQDFGLHGEPRE